MADVDLSVIVTAHNETIVAGPTMKSADDAVMAAEANGITVEKIIALDSATPACSEFFNQPDFDNWTRIIVEQRISDARGTN